MAYFALNQHHNDCSKDMFIKVGHWDTFTVVANRQRDGWVAGEVAQEHKPHENPNCG